MRPKPNPLLPKRSSAVTSSLPVTFLALMEWKSVPLSLVPTITAAENGQAPLAP